MACQPLAALDVDVPIMIDHMLTRSPRRTLSAAELNSHPRLKALQPTLHVGIHDTLCAASSLSTLDTQWLAANKGWQPCQRGVSSLLFDLPADEPAVLLEAFSASSCHALQTLFLI